MDRSILDGETDGFVRIHVRKGTDEILGATVVANAGDLISELTLAMKGKLGRKTGDIFNRTRLTPFVKNLMGRWLAWWR